MRHAVLADTGPLYALTDTSDQHHERASQQLDQLNKQARQIVVSFPVLAETYTLILHRLGNRYAHAWLEGVRATGALINPDANDYRGALRLLDLFLDQNLTVFDAVTAALSDRLGLPVWTFDHHFEVLQRPVWR